MTKPLTSDEAEFLAALRVATPDRRRATLALMLCLAGQRKGLAPEKVREICDGAELSPELTAEVLGYVFPAEGSA